MKKQKTMKKIHSAVALLLCCVMAFSVAALTSCQSADTKETETQATEECASVVRVKKGVLSGKQISGENLELVEVPVSGIPEGAIDSIDAIVGKYAVDDMVMGEYVFDRMLSNEPPVEEDSNIEYLVVSDIIELTDGKDITSELQGLIDAYPGRTIYLNDGVYNISSTVYLPSDKTKAVSLRLSNYATIKAASSWSGDDAMIAIGTKTEAASAEKSANTVMGGIIDGAGLAKVGLSLENCKNTLVSNVTVKNTKTAVWVKSSAVAVNVEGVTVNGDGSAESVGILNDASSNVFSTINMANVAIGLKNSGSYNDFRNISVSSSSKELNCYGFYEAGSNNVFELCTSQEFANGYFIKDGTASVFEACNAYWSKADVTQQNAFVADGTFNSVIVGCMVRFFDDTSANAYIKITTLGSGVVKMPIFDQALCDDDSYKLALSDTVISIK